MSDPSRTGPSVVAKLFGALLMAVGGLITTLCGLCSAAILVAAIANATKQPNLFAQNIGGSLVMVLLFGGVPIAFGVGVFLWGLALYRGQRMG